MIQQKRQWLADIRASLELTTYQAAERCGISQSFYFAIENGTRIPSVPTAKTISGALGFNWQRFYLEEPGDKQGISTSATG